MPAWALMWVIAFGFWLVCKGAMLRAAMSCETASVKAAQTSSWAGAIAYLIGWPGMDARPFLFKTVATAHRAEEWLEACAKCLIGAALVWVVAPHFLPSCPMIGGWTGMIGVVMLLHFGLFQLIALAWQARGVAVEPIMCRPTRAQSLADFWGRWNRGFRDLAFRTIFRPLHRRAGTAWATLATFAFSGLVHDLVISVPANAAFGLPTLYFLMQGVGILFEKSAVGRHMHPMTQRALMYVVLIAPLGLLFHPPFVRHVFVPFLTAIGGAS